MKNIVNAFSDKTRLIDTMRLMDGPAFKKMVSLDKMAMLLLGHKAKQGITGKDVHDLILDSRGDDVIQYCARDVDILRKCYKVLASMGVQ